MTPKASSVRELSRQASRYEYFIPDYEQYPDPYSRTWILLEWIGRGKRVLELGCATGFMSRYLVQRRGCSVIGIEVDPEASVQAKKSCRGSEQFQLDRPTGRVYVRYCLNGRRFGASC
jgi:SAM-dependent methyltransferase